MSKSTNFFSYWDHNNLVQKWIKSSEIVAQETMNCINPLVNSYYISKLTSIATNLNKNAQIQNEIESVEIEDNVKDQNEELSSEMIEFYKITFKHREERNFLN